MGKDIIHYMDDSMLERKGVEFYPSKDKAVIFFEVPDLKSAIAAQGRIG